MIFSEEQLERYSRHFVLREIGVSGQKRLLASKVLVIGAGALGSGALMYLAAAGVGTLGIADNETVDASNLQRQIIHDSGSIGMKKALSAEQAVRRLNPDVAVNTRCERMTADNIRDVIADYDFIIDGTDRFESKFLINDACVLSKKPYSHAGAVRFEGQLMTYIPGRGPCLRCMLGGVPPRETALTYSQAGVLGAVTGVIGSLQALEAIKYLLGIGEPLVGKLLHFDGLTMQFRTLKLSASDPDCAVCGNRPTIRDLPGNREEYEEAACSVKPQLV